MSSVLVKDYREKNPRKDALPMLLRFIVGALSASSEGSSSKSVSVPRTRLLSLPCRQGLKLGLFWGESSGIEIMSAQDQVTGQNLTGIPGIFYLNTQRHDSLEGAATALDSFWRNQINIAERCKVELKL